MYYRFYNFLMNTSAQKGDAKKLATTSHFANLQLYENTDILRVWIKRLWGI